MKWLRAGFGIFLALAACDDQAKPAAAGRAGDGGLPGAAGGGAGSDAAAPLPDTCANGLQDGDEVKIDCGGGCLPCPMDPADLGGCLPVDCAADAACVEFDCAEADCPRRECRPFFGDCAAAACASDQVCRTFRIVGQGTFAQRAYCTGRAAAGAECFDQCSEGEFCDLEAGQCLPDLAAGMACQYGDDHCGGGTRCAVATCEVPVAVGGECDGDTFCEPALHCVDFLCEPRPSEGAECQAGECAAGLYCLAAEGAAGVCRALSKPGERCTGRDGCEAGAVCATPLAAESQCADDMPCADGQCCAIAGVNLCVPADLVCESVQGLCVPPTDAEGTAACVDARTEGDCAACCDSGEAFEFWGGDGIWYCECQR